MEDNLTGTSTRTAAPIMKQLECAICCCLLRDPRVLPCLHTFCRRCIENIILDRQNKRAECPSCNREIPLESYRTVKGLPRDAMAIALHDELSLCNGDVMLCDVCDEAEEAQAVCRCRECALYLCGVHEEGHRRAKDTKDHALLSPEFLKSVSIKELHRPALCDVHRAERLLLFCNTCNAGICRNCALRHPHRNHQYQFMDEAFAKAHPRLMDLLSEAKLLCASVENSIPAIESMLTRVDLAASKALHDIDDSINTQIRALEERRKKLRGHVETVRAMRRTALGLQRERMRRARGRFRDSCQVVRIVLEEADPVYLLSMKDNMAAQLNALMTEEYNLYPKEDYYLKFTANSEELIRAIECYGSSDTSCCSYSTSTAEGSGLLSPQLGQEENFDVITRDREGRSLSCNEADLLVTIEGPNGDQIDPTLTEKHPGKYIISYTPPQVGQYKIAVTIRTFPISGSPFIVNVPYDELRDYSRLEIPHLTFGAAGRGSGELMGARGVAVDSANRIIVCDRDNARIQVFDPSGNFLYKFGRKGGEDGEFKCGPSDVTVDSSDRIIVSDWSGGSVLVFDSRGRFLRQLKPGGEPFGHFCHLATDQEGRVLVSDYQGRKIHVFDTDGKAVTCFTGASTDEGDGLLNGPSGIAVNSKGEIIVGLANDGGFQVFDSSGKPIRRFTVNELETGGNLFTPESLAIDERDNILAIDNYNDYLLVLDPTGKILSKCIQGRLTSPYGVAMDHMGRVIISDDSHSIKIF